MFAADHQATTSNKRPPCCCCQDLSKKSLQQHCAPERLLLGLLLGLLLLPLRFLRSINYSTVFRFHLIHDATAAVIMVYNVLIINLYRQKILQNIEWNKKNPTKQRSLYPKTVSCSDPQNPNKLKIPFWRQKLVKEFVFFHMKISLFFLV